MTSVLQTTHLSKRYKGKVSVEDLTLDVPKGSIYGLVGSNGAGKTTTIKMLMNIIRPSTGRAEVLGVDSRRLHAAEFTRIGYVSENQEMPDWMTIEQMLAYLRPFYPKWDVDLEQSMVKDFDLPRDRKLCHLSRGMLMKAALVSSLAYRPELLVLDEPFGGLDPVVREDLIHGILASAGETTVLISSHDLSEIESFATHIAFLAEGRLRFAEEMDSLVTRFRQVEVTVDPNSILPERRTWPREWLQPEASQVLVRFVDTCFDEENTAAVVRRHFSGVRTIAAHPVPLRSIFVALARSSSKSGEQAI